MDELPGMWDESDFTNGQTDYIDFIDDGQYVAPYTKCAYCNIATTIGYWCSAHCFSEWQRKKSGSNYNPYVWPDRSGLFGDA